jgi:hypothetical protein
MEHDALPFHDTPDKGGITHVAAHKRQLAADGAGEVVQPAIGVERIIAGERGNVGPVLDEPLRQMRSDKSIGAGDQNVEIAINQGPFLSCTCWKLRGSSTQSSSISPALIMSASQRQMPVSEFVFYCLNYCVMGEIKSSLG